MKKTELIFTVALVPLDFLLVLLAALSAYNVRFGWLAGMRPVVFDLPIRDYWLLACAGAGLAVFYLALAGLYRIGGPRRLKSELSRIFLASSTTVLTFIVIIFFQREMFSSRFIILAGWAFIVVYLSVGRILVRFIQRLLLRFGIGTKRVVIIGGDDHTTKTIIGHIQANPAYGYRLVSVYREFNEKASKELSDMMEAGRLDEILIADPTASRSELSRILGFAQARQVTFKYSAGLIETHAKNIDILTLAGIPIVEVKGTRLDGWGRIYKRVFDLVFSAVLIVILSPVMLLTALAVVLDSRGPVFFSRLDDGSPNWRIGERGRKFHYFKFRSMYPKTDSLRYTKFAHLDTRGGGPLTKLKDDPRITRVGKFIRRFSLDELPELFNVFIGNMSLVGPRPHMPEEVAKYQDRDRRVFATKPGITGLAQVSGRSDLTFEEEIRLDTYYVENWSPWLDIAILLKTPLAVFGWKGTV